MPKYITNVKGSVTGVVQGDGATVIIRDGEVVTVCPDRLIRCADARGEGAMSDKYTLWRDARRLRDWLEQYAWRKRTPEIKRRRILSRTLPMAVRRVVRRCAK